MKNKSGLTSQQLKELSQMAYSKPFSKLNKAEKYYLDNKTMHK